MSDKVYYYAGVVYILFGDTPRTDGGNIIGVFQDEDTANHEKEYWEKKTPGRELFIEKHTVWKE